MSPIRVLVADDQHLLRASLSMLLDAEPDLVVAQAADGHEAVAGAADADVVLMDIRMPRMDGLAATRVIAADPALAAVRVVILTTFGLDEYVYAALRAGASGFLLKDTDPQAIVDAVRRAHTGEPVLAAPVFAQVVADYLRAHDVEGSTGTPASLERLTPREREVLALIGRGLSNADVEAELVISRSTVKTHVSRLLDKLGARDRAQLVVAAYESGLVTPGR